LTVNRADMYNICPGGTTSCIPDRLVVKSSNGTNTTTEQMQGTSAEDTICYPPDEHEEKCPITDIVIISNSAISDYEQREYTVIVFNETDSIAFTKMSPQLPITTFSAGYTPCMDPFY